jgi:hypothetical protein
MVFPEERGKCCARGTRVLDGVDNPPIDAAEQRLLDMPKASYYSKSVNSMLSFAVIGTTPGKTKGGRGLNLPKKRGPCVYTLQGSTYHMWVPPSDRGPARGYTNGGGDALPDIFVLDGAKYIASDRSAVALMRGWRKYLRATHPLARVLKHVNDIPDRPTPLEVRIAASTAVSDEMEIALVYPDDNPGPPSRTAFCFPMASDPAATYKNTRVPDVSALFDIMRYPLLFCRGRGGFNMPATTSRVARLGGVMLSAAGRVARALPSRTGARHVFTLVQWARSHIYQNSRLHAHGRLMQEWVLNQFSRFQKDALEFLRHRTKTAFMAPMHAVRAGSEAIEEFRRRVYLSSKFVGGKRYLNGKVADGMAIVMVSCSAVT